MMTEFTFCLGELSL